MVVHEIYKQTNKKEEKKLINLFKKKPKLKLYFILYFQKRGIICQHNTAKTGITNQSSLLRNKILFLNYHKKCSQK